MIAALQRTDEANSTRVSRILLFVDRFIDFPDATPICAKRIAEGLAERGISVGVFTTKIIPGKREWKHSGIQLFEVENINYYANYMHLIDGDKRRRFGVYALSPLVKLYNRAFRLIFKQDVTRTFVSKSNKRKAIAVVTKFKPDLIMSFAYPYSTHKLASYVAKRTNTSWVPYSFDPYTLNYTLPKCGIRKREKWEEKLFSEAALVIYADGIADENARRGVLSKILPKTVSLPIPGLDIRGNENESYRSQPQVSGLSKIRLIFCGAFYLDIRRPEPLLEYLEKTMLNVELHLYGAVGYRLNSVFEQHPIALKKIRFHGTVDKESCDKACEEADVLVNVDNDIPNQIPSKILSYMAMGKPILNISSEYGGPSSRYLSQYPYACTVSKKSLIIGDGVAIADDFCGKCHPRLTKSELEDAIGSLTSDAVIDKLKNHIDAVFARSDVRYL